MKKLLVFILLVCLGTISRGQILKDILHRTVNDVKYKTEDKVSEKVNQGLDSLTKKRDKPKKKNKVTDTTQVNSTTTTQAQQGNADIPSQTTTTAATGTQENNSSNNSGITEDADPYNSDGSFIILKVFPTKVFLRNSVSISGTSAKYQNLNKVVMTITAENKVSQSKEIPLKDDGTFSTTWQPGSEGDYTIQVKSSDGKNFQTEDISVYELTEIKNITQEPKKETEKAYKELDKNINAILPMLSSKDASDLQKEMTKITQRKDDYLKLLGDLDNAGQQFDAFQKQNGPLPTPVIPNFAKVIDTIQKNADYMKRANDAANHQPYDNSVCEYITMIKEACAAFSTITNFGTASIVNILKNIAIDKGSPNAVDAADKKLNVKESNDMSNKECTKILATAKFDAESLQSKLGVAGFAGDMISMCGDYLLNHYCTTLSGDLSENYKCTLRNNNNNVWWEYGYTTQAIISLRCPKGNVSGGIMKMKGNIEGNATHFSIYQDVKEIDEFREKMQGKEGLITMYSLCMWSPPYVPFSSTKADQKTGFGAAARWVATPAYFNIPIDADYNIGNKKLTIYVNNAIVDFGPQVSYVYVYVAIAAGTPIFNRVNYPINKVKLTLGKVISDHNTFNVTGDKKVSVNGKAETHLGDAGSHIEQRINLDFLLKGG